MVKVGDQIEITFGKRRFESGIIAGRGSSTGRWKVTCNDGKTVEYPYEKFRVRASVKKKRGAKKVPKRKQCAVCKKIVYENEKLSACGKIYHDSCFQCFNCKKTLNLQTFKDYRGEPFCVTCYGRTDSAAVGFGPGRVGNYEKAYAAKRGATKKPTKEKSPASSTSSSASSVSAIKRAARRSFERRKKPSWATVERSPRKKASPSRSPTRDRLLDRSRSPPKPPAWKSRSKKKNSRRAPPPKKVSLVDTKRSEKRYVTSKPGAQSYWECVFKSGVSYRTRRNDNSSKIKTPRGPSCGDVVKATQFIDGWIRVKPPGPTEYWLPTKLDGVGMLFRKVNSKDGGTSNSIMSFFTFNNDESEEEYESEEEEEAAPAPPRVPVRRAKPPPRKTGTTKKNGGSSFTTMIGGLFSSLAGPTDAEKGKGSQWECVFKSGVALRSRRNNNSKVSSPRGPEEGDIVRVEEFRDNWICTKVNGKKYWLPTQISGLGTVFKLHKKAPPPREKKKRPYGGGGGGWSEERYGA